LIRHIFTAIVVLLFTIPAFAQDTRGDFSGSVQVTFADQYWTGKTCSYVGSAAVKSVNDSRYSLALSYTLYNLTPVLDDCFRPYPYEFTALCRSWVTSTGTMNIDVVGVGTVTVTPNDSAVKQLLSKGSTNENYGFGALMLTYRLTKLPDGSLEIFAYRY